MPFDSINKNYVTDYCSNHLPSDEWFNNEFNFISDTLLRERIIVEFKNVRYMYKLFEGIEAKDELLLAEVRLQIFMYASIYEAIIHYLLFDCYSDETIVKSLLIHTVPKKISIPTSKQNTLNSCLQHDGKEIFPFYYGTSPKPITSVRFDEKCYAAQQLGLISDFISSNGSHIAFVSELIKIYEIRNGIHIHAEIRKQVDYELELSKIAYRRMKPFIAQIKQKMLSDGKIESN